MEIRDYYVLNLFKDMGFYWHRLIYIFEQIF